MCYTYIYYLDIEVQETFISIALDIYVENLPIFDARFSSVLGT